MKELNVFELTQTSQKIDEFLTQEATLDLSAYEAKQIKKLATRLEQEVGERIAELFGGGSTTIRDIYPDLHKLFDLLEESLHKVH